MGTLGLRASHRAASSGRFRSRWWAVVCAAELLILGCWLPGALADEQAAPAESPAGIGRLTISEAAPPAFPSAAAGILPRPLAPDSPAQRFAALVDRDPLVGPSAPPPKARLAYWQQDVNEGGEVTVEQLDRRLQGLEAAQSKAAKKETKGFAHRMFGRMQADGADFSQGPTNKQQLGNIPNGTDFRRVRIGMQGEGHEIYFYRFEVDFVQADSQTKNRPRVTDIYFEVRQLPWLGTVRLGQYREPISVERITSGNDITFIERGLPQAFNPARKLGIMVFNHSANEKWYWWNGIFDQDNTDFGEQFGDSPRLAVADRLVYVPWYDTESKGRYMMQLGASYSYQNVENQTRKFSSTPEVSMQYNAQSIVPSFVSTGNILMSKYQMVQCEASTVLGPLSFQAEYYGTFVDQTNNPMVFLHGAYAYVSYFLTGENRVYDRQQGIYVATKPHSDFFRVRTNPGIATGPGAWEVGARFSTLNLSDKNIQGGRLNDLTIGLNWYLNFQTKVMFNYIHAFLNRDNRPSNADVFLTRAQVVW